MDYLLFEASFKSYNLNSEHKKFYFYRYVGRYIQPYYLWTVKHSSWGEF